MYLRGYYCYNKSIDILYLYTLTFLNFFSLDIESSEFYYVQKTDSVLQYNYQHC